MGFDDNFQFAGSFCHESIGVQCTAFDCFESLVLPLQSVFNIFHPFYFLVFTVISNIYGLSAEIGCLTKIIHIAVYKLPNKLHCHTFHYSYRNRLDQIQITSRIFT